ncbi:HlyD family secretion protein, partial [Sulfurimonas sp. SAG-AH-194-L11]|nr:HlyD family secretion protein [Sulfurimonas sp. SAG-AH-194-L11]
KEINTLKTQIADLELRQKQLLHTIKDKSLHAEGFKLYSLEVKVGEVVNKGTPLATLMDTTHALLSIYLNEEDVLLAKNSIIYINGKKTDYKIDRLLNIADSKNISKYKAQIIIKAPKVFSKLAEIELKIK